MLNKKRVGILYIAIGKYSCFWESFYKHCERNFLKGHKKTYYLFTDQIIKQRKNVRVIYQENLGWPNNTLKRFHMFLRIEDELLKNDYLYFINANMIVKRKVRGGDIFPNEKQKLVATLHPGFYGRSRDTYTHDENIKSTAYISKNEGKYYFMGGFNGGIAKDFIEMCKVLKNNIDIDERNNVVAVWHDESHLNKYMLDKNPLILDSRYGFPEGMPWNKDNLSKFLDNYKIIILDKNNKKYGGQYYLRTKD